ncbi:hypothetical protein LTR17_021842 [Elasticomyces elasticus]|nr:hypothetical protein LTR17_021842 [Elasticomyces elasticus]
MKWTPLRHATRRLELEHHRMRPLVTMSDDQNQASRLVDQQTDAVEQQTNAAQRKNVRAAVREARKALIARYPDLGLDQLSASHLNWRAREQDLRTETYAAIERAMLSMRQEDFERIYSSVWKDEILKGKKKSEQKTEQAGRLAQDAHQPKSGDDGGGSGASEGQISSPSLTERTETQPPDPRCQLDFLLNKD